MSEMLEHVGRIPSRAIQAPLFEGLPVPGSVPGTDGTKVVIKGDIRLRVTASYAGRRPVRGRYTIETEGMQEPLHVIWMIEGHVLNHTVHCIEIAFDVRGAAAGETLTRLLSAQVTDRSGQGCIVHSSIFVQIFVVRDDLPPERSEPLHLCQVAREKRMARKETLKNLLV